MKRFFEPFGSSFSAVSTRILTINASSFFEIYHLIIITISLQSRLLEHGIRTEVDMISVVCCNLGLIPLIKGHRYVKHCWEILSVLRQFLHNLEHMTFLSAMLFLRGYSIFHLWHIHPYSGRCCKSKNGSSDVQSKRGILRGSRLTFAIIKTLKNEPSLVEKERESEEFDS